MDLIKSSGLLLRSVTGLVAMSAITPALNAAPQAKQQGDGRPNILFILSDDHTSQAWGIYGGVLADYAKNPNIRRLASEGTVLDNCFCTNSLSAPSRASILTGMYSHRNQLYTLADTFDTGLPRCCSRAATLRLLWVSGI